MQVKYQKVHCSVLCRAFGFINDFCSAVPPRYPPGLRHSFPQLLGVLPTSCSQLSPFCQLPLVLESCPGFQGSSPSAGGARISSLLSEVYKALAL